MICVGSQWILGPLILSHTQISSLPGIRQKCCWGLFMEHWHDLPSWTVEQHKRLMVFYDSHTLDPCWFFHQWGSFILLRNVSLSQNYKHNNNIYIYQLLCILSVWPICFHLLMFSKRINVPPSIPPILKGRLSPAKACKHIWQHPQNTMRKLQGRYTFIDSL